LSGVLRKELRDHLARAVGDLPELFREAFVLHFVEGARLRRDQPPHARGGRTLRVRAHRTRTLLRERLGPVVDTWLAAGPRK